ERCVLGGQVPRRADLDAATLLELEVPLDPSGRDLGRIGTQVPHFQLPDRQCLQAALPMTPTYSSRPSTYCSRMRLALTFACMNSILSVSFSSLLTREASAMPSEASSTCDLTIIGYSSRAGLRLSLRPGGTTAKRGTRMRG